MILEKLIENLPEPDEEIQRDGKIYLLRWHVIRDYGKHNVYIHKFVGNDNDDALHDHPWQWCSILIKGKYKEITKDKDIIKEAGSVTFREAEEPHRIELINNEPCWTLFITGPKTREWGFLCPEGLKHWKNYDKDGGC